MHTPRAPEAVCAVLLEVAVPTLARDQRPESLVLSGAVGDCHVAEGKQHASGSQNTAAVES